MRSSSCRRSFLLFLFFLFFAAFVSMVDRGSAAAAPPDVSLSSALGAPGSTVFIDVILTNNGARVVAAGVDVQFNHDVLNLLSCEVGPAASAAQKQLIGPARFCSNQARACGQGLGCLAADSCNTERIGIFGFNTSTIADGIVATCSFQIQAAAPAGVLPLFNLPAYPAGSERAIDADGEGIPGTTGGNGMITIVLPTSTPSIESPTVSVTPSPTSTPSPSASPTATSTVSRTTTSLGTMTASPTIAVTRTETPRPPCGGVCSGNREVSLRELVTAVGIVLEQAPEGGCIVLDVAGDGIGVEDLVTTVNLSASGCPSPPP